jgi:uncharacterized membrane protein YbhN (UPF0104 family)
VTAQLEQPVAHRPSRWYRNRWVKRGLAAGLGLAVVVGTFVFVLPQFANYGEVWARVESLSWRWIVILLATVALNIVTFAPPWMAVLAGRPSGLGSPPRCSSAGASLRARSRSR